MTFQGYTGHLSFCGNELSIPGRVQPWGLLGTVQGSVPGHAAESRHAGESREVFSLRGPHSSSFFGGHPTGSQLFLSLPASLGPGLHPPSEVNLLSKF